MRLLEDDGDYERQPTRYDQSTLRLQVNKSVHVNLLSEAQCLQAKSTSNSSFIDSFHIQVIVFLLSVCLNAFDLPELLTVEFKLFHNTKEREREREDERKMHTH